MSPNYAAMADKSFLVSLSDEDDEELGDDDEEQEEPEIPKDPKKKEATESAGEHAGMIRREWNGKVKWLKPGYTLNSKGKPVQTKKEKHKI